SPVYYIFFYNCFNLAAFSVTLVAVILSLGGKFIPFMEPLSRVSWFVGVIVAFAAYALLKKRTTAEKTGEQKNIG
ncbi:allantoin permease, partial [Escherichia coli]|nr:allantoin permease [Escherichia coli]